LKHFLFREDIHRNVSIIAYYSFNLNKIEYLTFFGDFLLFNQINEPLSLNRYIATYTATNQRILNSIKTAAAYLNGSRNPDNKKGIY